MAKSDVLVWVSRERGPVIDPTVLPFVDLTGPRLILLTEGRDLCVLQRAPTSGRDSGPQTVWQPRARIGQVFGAGGPRAFQFAAKLRF